ncbi:MAG TPA: tripartite tricarboxylate transporter substrate binding protein, partial [Burkholderiales bacterium]|nr:tripartite tricarboxylate transporter substrate binding protein [Burkholderiales bacterium]
TKPIRIINTTSAGGPAEQVARIVGQKLTEAWGQQVVIDTRAGAAGIIGAEIVARAAPDGYTLLLGSGSSIVIAPLVQKNVPYDPLRDFAPVSMVVISPFALVVHPSLGTKTVADLVSAAKAKPGQFNFGSTGVGSTSHLGGEQLKMLTGIDIKHVAYKGAVPAIADLVGAQIHMLFNSMASALPHVKSGRLTLLATCGLARSSLTPDTPALAETWPGYEVVTWYSIVAPAKTPRALVMRLNGELHRALTNPDAVARFQAAGNTPAPGTPEAMLDYTRSEITKFRKIIQAAGVRLDG